MFYRFFLMVVYRSFFNMFSYVVFQGVFFLFYGLIAIIQWDNHRISTVVEGKLLI